MIKIKRDWSLLERGGSSAMVKMTYILSEKVPEPKLQCPRPGYGIEPRYKALRSQVNDEK